MFLFIMLQRLTLWILILEIATAIYCLMLNGIINRYLTFSALYIFAHQECAKNKSARKSSFFAHLSVQLLIWRKFLRCFQEICHKISVIYYFYHNYNAHLYGIFNLTGAGNSFAEKICKLATLECQINVPPWLLIFEFFCHF